ncbi:restriction endonuclease subunit S [Flavobacterium soyae]|uniref:Restriction endonuclease subunit S n=1 Tax=Flavobacterium soyae TaxID=2903098 RepID=A0ABZ2UGD7_9FLAO
MEENNSIPDGWHLKQVVEFASKIQSGGTPKSDNLEYYNGEIPFVAIDDLSKSNKYISKTQKKITNKGLLNSSAWLVPKYSLLYSIYATLGVPRINLIEVATNQAILNIIPKKKIISLEFLYYLLLEKRNTILSHSAHTTQSNLNAKVVKELEFVFPKSTIEQNKIAEILSKIDEAISETKIIITKYNRIKTGLIQDLLTKGIDDKGNIRSEETHEFKDSPLGRIPKEWDCLELRKCIELHNNKRKPISALVRAKMIGEFPYYGATGIIDNINIYNVEGEFVLFGEDGDHFLKWKNQEQTILVNGKFNVSNHAHIVKGNHICSTKWLHYFYFHRDITFHLTRQGAGRFKLNKESLSSLPILVPRDINEQIKIIDKIEYLNNFINLYKIQNEKLQANKTGLMKDLLSGKKRVTHLIN